MTVRSNRKSEAMQNNMDTPEKCTTMARTSILCSRCKPIMAKAVENELPSATREAKLPSAKRTSPCWIFMIVADLPDTSLEIVVGARATKK